MLVDVGFSPVVRGPNVCKASFILWAKVKQDPPPQKKKKERKKSEHTLINGISFLYLFFEWFVHILSCSQRTVSVYIRANITWTGDPGSKTTNALLHCQ